VGVIASSSASGPENLLPFGEQILAVDIQLDAVAVRQPLYRIAQARNRLAFYDCLSMTATRWPAMVGAVEWLHFLNDGHREV
jgi:hypothetical protein